MLIKIFSIYDEKAQVYSPPFFSPAKGVALRQFADLVNDDKSTVHRYPADFKLYCLGEFDDQSGKIVSLAQPEFVDNASAYVKEPR